MKLTRIIILAALTVAIGSACHRLKSNPTAAPDSAEQPTEQAKPLPEGAIAFDYGNHLYFDVVVRDSIPARMIFDTGNTNILFDTQFFKKHFAPSPTLQRTLIQGAGNSLEAAYRDTSDWTYSVGGHSTTEQGATVLDLRKIIGYHVDGMYGMEFMRGRKVEFNYADGYMRILSQDEQPAEGYVCVKCKWLDGRQARMVMPVSIKVNERLSLDGNFLVDMGSSGSISLNSSVAAKLSNAITNVKKKVYDTGGVGGSRTDYIFKVDRVSVAGNDIHGLNIDLSGNTQGVMARNEYDGLVGNGLLEHFDVIIDFAKCEIWLRPNRNFGTVKMYDSGTTLTPQADGWIVNGLVEGGNAYKAGVRRGDMILSINGLTPEKVGIKELKRMNTSAEEWKVVVKRDNTTQDITLKKEKL